MRYAQRVNAQLWPKVSREGEETRRMANTGDDRRPKYQRIADTLREEIRTAVTHIMHNGEIFPCVAIMCAS